MLVGVVLVRLTGKLVVTGGVPETLRGKPFLLAANHIGNFDVIVLIAACHKIKVAPRFMATGGLFDSKISGPVMRASGHIRVNRGKENVADVMGPAVDALRTGAPVLVYPEGRISRDRGLWPERGKTGVSRMALASGVEVVPVAQWGAHEAMLWGSLTVGGFEDIKILWTSWMKAIFRDRPTFRVHFGDPVNLTDLSLDTPGDAVRARDRIMRAISEGLIPLRPGELDEPRFHDPTRPIEIVSPWKPAS
jgi:1-acyl-sn-glycerol-3-phosphate acyltransferase